jgi:hypothetical protein
MYTPRPDPSAGRIRQVAVLPRHRTARSSRFAVWVRTGWAAAGLCLSATMVAVLGATVLTPSMLIPITAISAIAGAAAVLAHLWPQAVTWRQPAALTAILTLGIWSAWAMPGPWEPLIWLNLAYPTLIAVRTLTLPRISGARTAWLRISVAALGGLILGITSISARGLIGVNLPQHPGEIAGLFCAGWATIAIADAAMPCPPRIAPFHTTHLVPWALLIAGWLFSAALPMLILACAYPLIAWHRRPIDDFVLASIPIQRFENPRG